MLSKGVMSKASVTRGSGPRKVTIVVDGDPRNPKSTTAAAVGAFVSASGADFQEITLEQTMEVPVGYGFGSSAAAAISGVYAVASALGIRERPERLASFAHRADIDLQTGLGTVSVSYAATGAGVIATPGGPGHATFVPVSFPGELRLVAGSISPYRKSDALGSSRLKRLVNEAGEAALRSVLGDPTLDSLASAGERFTDALGLLSAEGRALVGAASANGAIHASQNMVGQSVHALADVKDAGRVAAAMKAACPAAMVEVYDVARVPAGPL
jgi:pantoate kinase